MVVGGAGTNGMHIMERMGMSPKWIVLVVVAGVVGGLSWPLLFIAAVVVMVRWGARLMVWLWIRLLVILERCRAASFNFGTCWYSRERHGRSRT